MNEQERQYDTYQEGPYWRVNPRPTGESGQGDSSLRAQDGNADAGNPPGLARYGNAQSPAASQPVAVDFAHRAADEYSRKHLGKPYAPIENTPSSLRKQSAIGRIFKLAATHHPDYKQAVFEAYKAQRPDIAGDATDYDDLRQRAYAQLAHETKKQFDTLPVRMSFHRNGEGNYGSSQHMLDDVAKNRHLYVYQGGDPHEFLHEVDPRTGLNTNEMFRAVHDFFGHAVHGSSFGPHGEEKAWAAHSGLFTPLAQAALTSETRGQNSMVNYSPLNALLKARAAKLTEAMMDAHRRGDMDSHAELSALKKQLMDSFEFAPQAAVLLPPEFLHGGFKGGVPEYLKHLVVPEHGTSAELVHYSHEPRLSKTDPRMYGTGIRGAESQRLKEAPGGIPRTYFYVGEPKQKETGLGPHRYKTTVDRLYDIEQDPEHLHQLAREVNRTPHTAKYNQGIVDEDRAANEFERMAHEYGYKGVINSSRKIASVFDPQEVKSYASGGLVSRVDQVARQLKRSKGTVPEFLSELVSTPGVKKAELEARGLLDPAHLTERERTTRGMMASPPQGGVIDRKRFTDVLLRHAPAPDLDVHEVSERTYDKPDQYEEYTLPGGENYREVVFTHNPKSGGKFQSSHYNEPNVLAHTRLTDREGPNKNRVLHVEEIQSDWHQAGRKHGYQTPSDAQMLELASNDAQKARIATKHLEQDLATEKDAIARGEGDPARKAEIARQLNAAYEIAHQKMVEHEEIKRHIGLKIPDAPFKKDWHELVLRHLLRHAAAEGYDAIAVTPGEEQAKRYDLSKHIGEIHHSGSDFVAYSPEGEEVIKQTGVRPEDLPDLIGKELAAKLMAQKPQGTLRSLTGQDIKIGGEGMKGFYDHMIPLAMNKIGKKYGVQVTPQTFEIPHPPITTADILDDMAARGHSQQQINNLRAGDLVAHKQLMLAERAAQPTPTVNLHTMPITDEMRQDINRNGMPLFAKGGEVDADKNLQAFLKDSKVKTRMYHGTNKDFARFRRPEHGNFVSPDPEFVNDYLGEDDHDTHIMPVYVRATNPWDFDNPEHMAAVKRAAARKYPALHSTHATLDAIGYDGDNWSHIEHPDVQDILKGLGHDAYYTREGGVRNLAVYDPRNIKSAIGNQGTYDPESADIRKAQGGTVQTQNNLITTLAQRLGMTPAQVMQAIQQQQPPQDLAEGGQPEKKRKSKKKGRLSLSDLMQLSQTGAEEAPDLPIKEFVNPGHDMIPEGGVQMPNGAPFPIGPQQQAAQSQTGIPGQVQGGAPLAAIAAMLHQGPAGAPQPGQQPGQGNMLALTHQGQAMQAMKPPMPQPPVQRPMPPRPGMPAMAKGGKVKMSTADMRRALEARKRTVK